MQGDRQTQKRRTGQSLSSVREQEERKKNSRVRIQMGQGSFWFHSVKSPYSLFQYYYPQWLLQGQMSNKFSC